MLKKFIYLRTNNFFLINRSLSLSEHLNGKWFYVRSKVMTPPTKLANFDHDWEHKVGLNMNRSELLKGVTEIEEYQRLPAIIQQTYSYKYLPRQSAIDQEIAVLSMKLSIDEIIHPLAYKIIKETTQIRYKKEALKIQYRKRGSILTINDLIKSRNSDLQQLKLIDGDKFQAICKEFKISFVDTEPECREDPPDPKFKEVRQESTKLKEKKVKSFREHLKASEEQFYIDKRRQLKEVEASLSRLNVGIEEVYEEVIGERLERVLKPIHDEEFRWFEREKELKVYYDKLSADKKAAQERQSRR